MSFPFFQQILKFLGKKLSYDAVVNYAGNMGVKDAWKIIEQANPIVPENKMKSTGMNHILSNIKVSTREEALDGMDWVMELEKGVKQDVTKDGDI